MIFTLNRTSVVRSSLARVLILILAGAFVGLMSELRVEHVVAVRERAIAWLPIVYAGFMSMACIVAFACWNRTVRRIMIALFLVASLIGVAGFYLHNRGSVNVVLKTFLNAWTDPTMNHSGGPPLVAPLAFAGLGLIGILASLERYSEPQDSHSHRSTLSA